LDIQTIHHQEYRSEEAVVKFLMCISLLLTVSGTQTTFAAQKHRVSLRFSESTARDAQAVSGINIGKFMIETSKRSIYLGFAL
jgi:hypothetical protein